MELPHSAGKGFSPAWRKKQQFKTQIEKKLQHQIIEIGVSFSLSPSQVLHVQTADWKPRAFERFAFKAVLMFSLQSWIKTSVYRSVVKFQVFVCFVCVISVSGLQLWILIDLVNKT